MKIKPITGQAARMVALFSDIREMPQAEFFSLLKALDEFRIRDAIFTEIGPCAIEESTDTDKH